MQFLFCRIAENRCSEIGQTNRIGIGVDSADAASNGTNTACSDASSSPSTKTGCSSCPAGRSVNAIACTAANAHPNTDYTGTDSTCFPVGRYSGGIPECESGSFRQPCGIGCLYSGRNALDRCKESVFLTLLKNHENARSLGDTVRQILGQEYKILAKCSNPAQTEVSPVQTLLQKAKDSNLETAVE